MLVNMVFGMVRLLAQVIPMVHTAIRIQTTTSAPAPLAAMLKPRLILGIAAL